MFKSMGRFSFAEVSSSADDEESKKKEKPKGIPGRNKKGRLIVRNLSFKATEKTLSKVFSKHGDVKEINIPKKQDGKMRGFAFVQYENMKNAIFALNALNGKEILGRPVAIDFAFSKNKFEASKPMPSEDFGEVTENNNVVETAECERDVKIENKPKKRRNESSDSENASEDDSQEFSDSEIENDEKGESKKKDPNEGDEEDERKKKRSPAHSNDINEGRTVFLRNLSFDTSPENLKEAMAQFGTVKYCLLCIDKVTEHPKGTAFVQFSKKEEAEKCIQNAEDISGDGMWLDGRKLSITLALSKEDIQKKLEDGQKKHKDNRNLYLLTEGLIRPGSEAAEGVSQPDLMKRLRLEALKRKRLRNFHNFISSTRLCVHNLPDGLDDRKLRQLFLQASGPKAHIIEARIMRNMKNVDGSGKGMSKGFGFVNFTTHDHALQALRQLNNNPNVFTSKKRPIVEFSVENMLALRIKKNRLERYKGKTKKGSAGMFEAKSLKQEVENNGKFSKVQNHHKAKKKNLNHKDSEGVRGAEKLNSSKKKNNLKKMNKPVKNYKGSEGITSNSKGKKNKTAKTSKSDKSLKKRKDLNDNTFAKLTNKYRQILNSGDG